MQLQNRVAVITGAAGVIGAAAVRRFVAEGAQVLAVDLEEGPLKALVDEVGSQNASFAVADVTREADMTALAATARERYGHVDVFLANAGIEGKVQPIFETRLEDFEKVMRVNVSGVFLGIKHIAPLMVENGGAIVITSSIAGLRGTPGVAPYGTSKHAVIGLMRSAAAELAAAKVRVNTVNPAPIHSRMIESLERGMGGDDAAAAEARERMTSRIPLGRYGEPEEVVDLMLFLSGDGSRYLTGGVYSVDGGMTAL